VSRRGVSPGDSFRFELLLPSKCWRVLLSDCALQQSLDLNTNASPSGGHTIVAVLLIKERERRIRVASRADLMDAPEEDAPATRESTRTADLRRSTRNPDGNAALRLA
jgi:hypothetical protein